uniref:Putative bZIP transcription factor family protein 10 n=1 Tax=Davidia involucrata TaxID=16924 RepID=A0A5B6YW90_DAVIN
MVDPSVADPIPPNSYLPTATADDFDCLPIPPLDATVFSDYLNLPDDFISDLGAFDDVEDFDFTLDDFYFPSENEDFLSTLPASFEPPGLNPAQISADPSPKNTRVSNCPSQESGGFDQGRSEPELYQISGDQSSSGARVLNSLDSGGRDLDFTGVLNVPFSESGGFDRECSQESGNECSDVARVLNYPSPDSENHNREISGPASSQDSGNCGFAVSEALNYPSPDSGNCARSVASSPNFVNNSIGGFVDQKIELEELSNNCLLKRKKENEDLNSESRTSKYRRSNGGENANPPYGLNATSKEEEKRKARLMRNRESAQLSRQRKKHHVEELEDKVRTMHSTIQDLNTKISYIMAENASLRQQLSGGGGAMCPPPGMYPHPPMAPMGYPWMPCPPYVVKPQGSQIPLVPIPRLKPQQPAKAKKVETKGKTKKVASVSFLGLLFFIILFGGLVPMVNLKYRGLQDGSNYTRFYDQDQHRGSGKVLKVNGHLNGTDQNIGMRLSNNGKFGTGKDFTNSNSIHHGAGSNVEPKDRGSHPLAGSDEFVRLGNASEPLVASLYVPRNDKLVKIDGNLIIHSVLASEKAMASREAPGMKSGRETGLALARNLAPAIPVSERNNGRHPLMYRSPTERQRALASGAAEKDNLKSKMADGKLQQWFREGLAGPMLHSGMCTEVFNFDVSPASAPGVIIPATSVRNISAEHHQNSTHLSKGKNRRILRGLPIPLPGSIHNITKEHVGRKSEKENFHGSNSLSSMVVSVLVDPKETGDSDGDGMMGPKSLSRIFVVVLLDGVKYVTYSCMLPFKGSGHHLVTT